MAHEVIPHLFLGNKADSETCEGSQIDPQRRGS